MTRAKLKIRFREAAACGRWTTATQGASGGGPSSKRRRTRWRAPPRFAAISAERNRAPPDPIVTLAEYAEQWLTIVSGELEPATWRHYRASLRLHILPGLGRIKLRELRRRHVKALLNAKRAEGYAPNGVRLDELIEANPAFQVGRRKRRRQVTAPNASEGAPDDVGAADAFLAAAAAGEPRSTTLFSLLAKTGVRPGEGLALQPGDIDWGSGRCAWSAHEPRAGQADQDLRGPDGGLTPELVEALARHMTWLKDRGAAPRLGRARVALPERGGQAARRGAGRKVFKRALGRAKLPTFRLYDLRHTYASWLVQRGRTLKEVQEALGHQTITMTMRYSHLAPDHLRAAVAVLDGVISIETASPSAQGSAQEAVPAEGVLQKTS